jgi:hypothetical protein
MQSYNLAIVGKSQDGKWQKEAYGLGVLDANGTKVDDQVSTSPTLSRT